MQQTPGFPRRFLFWGEVPLAPRRTRYTQAARETRCAGMAWCATCFGERKMSVA